jgi:hypothetical protein
LLPRVQNIMAALTEHARDRSRHAAVDEEPQAASTRTASMLSLAMIARA